jgi:hypothetical protein
LPEARHNLNAKERGVHAASTFKMPKIFHIISATTLKRAEARAPLFDVLWPISNRKS